MDPNIRRRVVELAHRQHGNITRQQLLGLGLGAEAIKHRARSGDFHRVHLGVYAVGRPPKSPLERAAAAVLACGPTASLSHGSAMVLWGVWKYWEAPEVTVTRDRRPRGIRVHHTRSLERHEIRTHYGIRVTSLARALADIAPRLDKRQLTRAVNDGLLTPYLQRDELARYPRLASFAATSDGPTRSRLEDDFLEFCERHGLPRPHTNTKVLGREVDAYFPDHRLIVELDGWRFHRERASFESDRERDAHALANGIATVRITSKRLTEPEAERLRAILDQAA
jgi:Transcriptional regulator, AbiEi antitoxin